MTKNSLVEFFADIDGPFVIYGCGRAGKYLGSLLVGAGIAPECFCDADNALHGSRHEDLPVLSPEQAGARYGASATFVIAVTMISYSPEEKEKIRATLLANNCKTILCLPDPLFHLLARESSLTTCNLTLIRGALFEPDTRGMRNIINHERVTIGHPPEASRNVFILGTSVAQSLTPDAYTISSYLQARLNARGREFRVRNFGVVASPLCNMEMQAPVLDICDGDYVAAIHSTAAIAKSNSAYIRSILAIQQYCLEKKAHFLAVLCPSSSLARDADASAAEQAALHSAREILNANGCPILRVEDGFRKLIAADADPFTDEQHFDRRGCEIVADSVAGAIAAREEWRVVTCREERQRAIRDFAVFWRNRFLRAHQDKMAEWFSSIPPMNAPAGARIGSIVMNCNPMTNGHLHLIREALRHVDCLYLFVVQEDRSFFSFEDRFRLVLEGVHSLDERERIRVCPSGSFIISALTFGDYFGKEVVVKDSDPSCDIFTFGAIIAPHFGIAERFVGEEPTCRTTRHYNDMMCEFLPPMGVNVQVFPRIGDAGEKAISASAVRKYMESGRLDAIRRMVPPSTYKFIAENLSSMMPHLPAIPSQTAPNAATSPASRRPS